MRCKKNLSKIAQAVAGVIFMFVLALSPQAATAQSQTSHPRASTRHAHADLLDINTATMDQLQAIPGIGEVYAKRIVAGRPYSSKRQLLTRGILPQDVYEKVKTQIIAHRVKK